MSQATSLKEAQSYPTDSMKTTTSASSTAEQVQLSSGPVPVPAWRFGCLSVALGIGLFLSFMDGSITSTAIYSIGAEFGSLTKVTWIALAYTLADVGLAIVFTSLANIIGRFNTYLLAQFIFFAFSFGSGFAQTLDQLIACRCLQGIGGSGLYTIALVIWQEISNSTRRKWIGGSIGLCIASGGVMGPILGGIITENASWRWIFWINPPIMVFSTVLFIVSFPHGGGRLRPADWSSARKVDIPGTLLLIAGCVLPCFSLMHAAEVPQSWRTGKFIGPIVAGVMSWVLLVAWEYRHTTKMPGRYDPAFPPQLFKVRRYAATAANSLLMGFGFVICIYNVPLRLQTINGKGPLQAGLSLLPLLCTSAIGSVLGTALSPTKDRLGPTVMVGSALMALGTGLLSTLGDSASVEAKVYGFQVFVGLGFGMTASSSSLLANIESKKKDHAVAQGIAAAARVLGGAIGLSAGTAIQGDLVRTKLKDIPAAALQHLATSQKDLTDVQRALVRKVYSESFNKIFLMATIVTSVAFLAGLFTYNTSTEPLLERLQHKGETESQESVVSSGSSENSLEKGEAVVVGTEKGGM